MREGFSAFLSLPRWVVLAWNITFGICIAAEFLLGPYAHAADTVVYPVPVFLFSGTNGAVPVGILASGPDANLYGTTSSGGAFGKGTIFRLATNGTFTSLVSFDGTNGSTPYGGLLLAADGNYYGTTFSGGTSNLGTVFRVTTNGGLTSLASFIGANGASSYSPLVQGEDGNMYGVTYYGGVSNAGTVFKLGTNGVLSSLVSFSTTNGANPIGGLAAASNGLFYGTTYGGGAIGGGTLFQVTTAGVLNSLASLNSSTGLRPYSGVTIGVDGNLYGVTTAGGALGYGSVFKSDSNGLIRVLFSFTNVTSIPAGAIFPLLQATDGNFYGATFAGGSRNYGQVFRIAPGGAYSGFADFVTDGTSPSGGLVQAADGWFYTVTQNGGYVNNGGIFRFKISTSPPTISLQPQSAMTLPGSNVTFGVSATGQWPLYYQWFKNSKSLTGATNAVYTVTNSQLTDQGLYSVQLSNALGSVSSSNASLSVGPVAIIKQPSNAVVTLGYNGTFGVSALGYSPLTYQWRKGNDDIQNATNSILMLANVQTANADWYSVVVSNTDACVTSSIVQLSVVSPYTFGTLAGTPGPPGDINGPWNSARITNPVHIAIDTGGALYVSEWAENVIRKITPDGQVSTLAGLAGFSGTNDGFGSAARFYLPEGLAVDSATNLYVADNFNNTIRKVTPDGTVTTWAGTPGVSGFRDGPNRAALFYQPSDVAIDPEGCLLVADWRNQAIRKILPNGVVVTVALTLNYPTGVAANSDVYFTDQGFFSPNYGSVRKISSDGTVSILASGPTPLYGIALDTVGNCFVGSRSDDTISEVVPTGAMVTLGGVSGTNGYADGAGTAARFNGFRMGLARDPSGNLYVADTINNVSAKACRLTLESLR